LNSNKFIRYKGEKKEMGREEENNGGNEPNRGTIWKGHNVTPCITTIYL
jgi:hypothetical protein